ncbi:hypothetical protein [Streptomyces sp. ST2-7A]|uniref:hypothetical protein n=1 Tax=Streptomyces sp. ST2-7A TaxID=2907214 RepID=UPI001F2AE7BE|nr:hypothetical protein [Streptomyces sp. ST2-7A]MCE7083482.1 hypothetical protein [Streptomyces sp. ST2-7A]
MTEVQLEEAELTDGISVLHMDDGSIVRAAYDPTQIDRTAALAWLTTRVPRLTRGYHLKPAPEPG